MLKIIYQDSCLMVIDKPANLVVTSSATQKEKTLEDILKSEFKINLDRAGVVHRLDKDTSGVMLIAKTQACFTNLQAQFKSRTVKKEYLALVHGWLDKEGKIEAPIARNPWDREKFIALALEEEEDIDNSREAVTLYQPLKLYQMSDQAVAQIFPTLTKNQLRKIKNSNYQLFTFLQCFPQTGRTHQIRVHLKYIGFPVVGDSKYGGRKTSRLDKRWCERQFLHAQKIEFNHPETSERLTFSSPLPKDLKEALKLLEPVSAHDKI